MEIVISPAGTIRTIYGEEIPLHALGTPCISRASAVEPTHEGKWLVDLSPVGGPLIGPLDQRSDALSAEVEWLLLHWLLPNQSATGEVQ